MSKYQSVRGTRDLLPAQKKVFRQIESIAYANAQNYGFGQIETPIFEFSDVFHRAMGEENSKNQAHCAFLNSDRHLFANGYL